MAPKKHRELTREDAHPLVSPSPGVFRVTDPSDVPAEWKQPQRRRRPVFPYIFQRPQNKPLLATFWAPGFFHKRSSAFFLFCSEQPTQQG